MISEAASGSGLKFPLAITAQQRFGDAVSEDLSEWDIAAMVKLIEKGQK